MDACSVHSPEEAVLRDFKALPLQEIEQELAFCAKGLNTKEKQKLEHLSSKTVWL